MNPQTVTLEQTMQKVNNPEVTVLTGDVDAPTPTTLPQLTLAQLERLYVTNVLSQVGGNKTKAAKILGVSLKTVYNKLAQFAQEDTKTQGTT